MPGRYMVRRGFLKLAAAGAATAAFSELACGESTSAFVVVHSRSPGRRVPASYVGLSYELAQLSEPTFFCPDHTDLISLFRSLNPSGLLRLGGNTSEFRWVRVQPSTVPIKLHLSPDDLAQNWMPHRLFAIQLAAIDALVGFLHATGWRAIYGLNFGSRLCGAYARR
jgi:hypothetical protein